PAAVNAARALAIQVNGAVSQFATNFMTSVNPQITKSYASGDRDYMMSLVYRGSRFSLYMLMLLSLPILFNTGYLLDLWQIDVPDHSVSFVRLVLILTMVEGISYPLITLMLATGNIKKYQMVVGGLQLLNIPVAFVALKNGGSPEMVYVVAIVIAICCLIARMILLRSMVDLNLLDFSKKVLFKVIGVAAISVPLPLVLSMFLADGFWNMIIICIVSVTCTGLAVWSFGLRQDERLFFRIKIQERLKRNADG
ncbi:MAG: lipopolysaccharide biosynthesis protein, partial [Bacteroidales bacterium]|nr:lipopolysaccharide biosynthesis protein [Bacteroidales bacterium]